MKINTPGEEYIFIELNKNDMKKLGLSYFDMNYSDEKTRKTIFTVLSQAKSSLGQSFDLSDTKRVEVLPRENGGCLLFFTVGRKKKRFRLSEGGCRLYFEFSSPDSLLDMKLSEKELNTENVRSVLYGCDGKYYLFLSGNIRSSLLMKISEYAYPVKSEAVLNLKDKKVLIGENALEILCSSVSE